MRALPLITSAMLVVTHECNLRCRYCFVRKEPRRMTLETAKAAADFLLENARRAGVRPEINFFGGEPMLMFDSVIKPLVEYVRSRGEAMRFSVTTNGTLLTPERIGFMKRQGFGLLLSMDGTAPVQDYNRPDAAGRGSFESVLWAAAQGFRRFFIVPDVFQPWDAEARGAMRREMRKYADYVAESERKGVNYIRFSSFEQAGRDLKAIARAAERGEYRALPRCRAAGKCGLGSGRFASVHPDGGLYACQELTSNEGGEFYIGSVFTGADEARRRALMARFDAAPARGEYCAECEYDRICDGGCVANNYMVTGKLGELPEVYCWWKRLLLAEAERIYGREGEICRTKA